MAHRTVGELNGLAMQIADMVAQTDVDQRAILYDLVAQQLVLRTQNYQASLFKEIAKVA